MHKYALALLACLALSSAKTITVTSDFDDLKGKDGTGPKPPKGYDNLTWWGDAQAELNPGAVENAGFPTYPFKGSSKPNVLHSVRGFSFGSSQPNEFAQYDMRLKSFRFACSYSASKNLEPIPCSIAVTVSSNVYENRTTYEYNYDLTDGKNPRFIEVEGPEDIAQNFEFNLIGQPLATHPLHSGTSLWVDNIVTVQHHPNY